MILVTCAGNEKYLIMLMLAMVLIKIMLTFVPDVYAANYDHANNYAYDYAEHDDHSIENLA